MKYIVVLGDGMADYKIDRLGGKTPLQYAETPNLDALAKRATWPTCPCSATIRTPATRADPPSKPFPWASTSPPTT